MEYRPFWKEYLPTFDRKDFQSFSSRQDTPLHIHNDSYKKDSAYHTAISEYMLLGGISFEISNAIKASKFIKVHTTPVYFDTFLTQDRILIVDTDLLNKRMSKKSKESTETESIEALMIKRKAHQSAHSSMQESLKDNQVKSLFQKALQSVTGVESYKYITFT
jgi:hypothetical protein